MRIPEDFEYVVHRPGNPGTHLLGNGVPAKKEAALTIMDLAREWLREVPVVGIEVTRFKILILISKDGRPHQLGEFHPSTQTRLSGHAIVQQHSDYIGQMIANFPVFEESDVNATPASVG